MKRSLFLLTTLLLLLVFNFLTSCTKKTKYDIIIKSGKIIDGTGNAELIADIGITGDQIVEIGTIPESKGKNIIDAASLCVVPSFIDIHTHVDRKIAEEPTVKNYLLQGVTTTVGGNCGASEYPLSELLTQLEEKGIAINFATYVGHNTVRRQVMGSGDRAPTDDEMVQMQQLVKQEMEAGAIGFSTGLSYVPGIYSTTEEIIELVKMTAPFNGIYATHLRNQGRQIQQAIEEAIRIGREAGVTVDISHIKLAEEAVWGKYHLITDPIENARNQGMRVYMDQYPYTATSSGFTSSLPSWAVAGGHDFLLERLKNPEKYQQIKTAIIERRLTSQRGIDKLTTIYVAYNENHHEYEGKNLAEILDMLGGEKTISNGADLIIEMEKTDRPRGVFFQMAEQDVAELMKKPYNMIGSDGKIEILGVEVPHPRAYGTFPRVIAKYVRDEAVLTLTDAIRKMTSLPAEAMRFEKRGQLKKGYFADIVIFDWDEIQDQATFENPHQYPNGIGWVIVNGKVAAQNGEVVERNGGRILYGIGRNLE
jgi:N-acyl-D-amino-acid deacylase